MLHCPDVICLKSSALKGQDVPPGSAGRQEVDDIFFDMSWLEDEEDWLCLKQEATHISGTMTEPDSIFQESDSIPQVPSPLSKIFHLRTPYTTGLVLSHGLNASREPSALLHEAVGK